MAFMEWTDEFSVGIPEIDADHQQLLKLLNDLYEAVETEAGDEVLDKVLDALLLYVSYHFAHEEGLFLRTKYPGYAKHRQAHLALRNTVTEIHSEFQSGARDALPHQVLEFLKTWLYQHIMVTDRAFGAYLKANRGAL
jgi:hemerythrin